VPPLPPAPYGGWGRWWRDNSDQLWIILFAAGVTVAAYLLQDIWHETMTRARMRLWKAEAAKHLPPAVT